MRKIFLSLLSIGAVAVIAVYATQAFFSDTESSTGNTFQAGAIDLLIDNESYAIDWNIPGYENPSGQFVASSSTSWLEGETIRKFFDFVDLKPGDYGEDTISIHVNNNDAWVCAAARVTSDNDVDYTEPEEADDNTKDLQNPANADGELDEGVEIAFWWDDGDNVFEVCPEESENCTDERVILQGTLGSLLVNQQGKVAIADNNTSPLPGGTTHYVGKYWCFGTLLEKPVEQDGLGKKVDNPQTQEVDESKDPLVRGTGFECNGGAVDNAAQTDVLVGDLEFYAVQSRHNPDFSCLNDWNPSWVTPTPSTPQ